MTLTELLENKGTSDKPILVQCCVCREYKTYSGEFIEVPKIMNEIYKEYCDISHSYCDGCADVIIKGFKRK